MVHPSDTRKAGMTDEHNTVGDPNGSPFFTPLFKRDMLVILSGLVRRLTDMARRNR